MEGVSLGRTERTSQDMTAALEQMPQESRGQDCWGRIAGTGQLGQDSQNAIARTGQPGQDSQRRQSGQYIQDRKQRTSCQNRTGRTGQQEQDS